MKKITFTGSLGEKLAARLDEPDGEIRAYALFAHCFTCTKDILGAAIIARTLTENGIAVLRFDFTGLGESSGDFSNTNFTSNVQDLVKAADYMREELQAPSILIGHSLGGAAVLVAAHDIPEVKAVATIAAPADAAHVAHHFENSRNEIMDKGEAEVCLVGRPFKIRKQFIEDIESQNMDDHIKNLKRALLVLHAPLDNTVGIENATKIFSAAKHPKSYVSLDNADHLLSKKENAIYAATVIANWASQYVPALKKTEQKAKTVQGVLVESTGAGKFQQNVYMGKHHSLADEPASHGGLDSGPDPYGFLMAALGTCTAMTLKMYADHKDLPLEGVSVHLQHEKIHAQDCESCETKDGKLDKFTRDIVIRGDLTDEQRARMIEIADKCPVHRTLHSEVVIETKEKKE